MGGRGLIILDTCALLWLTHEKEKMSPETIGRIDESPLVYVSAISAFEIGLKYGSGKLELPVRPGKWVREIMKHHDLTLIDVDFEICIRATELPPIHRDPCDRFIIATALVNSLTVVTTDDRFREYGVPVIC
jgi:PIN domain nuclease of toxin-antitoxin system